MSSGGVTTPSPPGDAGYSENNTQRNTVAPMGRGRAGWGGPAAANAPSATGQRGQQRGGDDNTEGGDENVDCTDNGKRKGGLSRSGSPSPEGATTTTTTSAPTTTTLKSAQDRRKIQHMAKTMSEVAIAAAGGAADTSPERTAGGSDTEREPRKGVLAAGAAEARGGDGKAGAAGAGKGMTDRQERALRAFLKGVRSCLPRQTKTT